MRYANEYLKLIVLEGFQFGCVHWRLPPYYLLFTTHTVCVYVHGYRESSLLITPLVMHFA